ncbi:MAG: sugar phosphate isomerase/epimerase [Chlorobi bacterium]|nr:sugar phosphate isomerase/epimerase [Chlorobiota bacterium]
MTQTRRTFVRNMAIAGAGAGLAPSILKSCTTSPKLFFKISLAQWSLHRTYFGDPIRWELLQTDPDAILQGTKDPLDFPIVARRDFGINAVEYVNTFYFSKARDETYLGELKKRCDDEGVYSNLIMCDAEGNLGDPDTEKREQAVENHYKWVEAAKFLGCRCIRVNARSEGTWEEQMKLAADGLRKLCEYGDKYDINIIVENHGGISSNGKWLTGVMKMVDHPRIGTLPDFGNFRISETETYDRYQGVKEMMPWARGVSAKSHNFDKNGNETETDYYKMLQIVKDAGYTDYIGIEYEGDKLSEYDGIRATKALLEKAGAAVS